MASTLPTLAIPGQRLAPVSSYAAGPGTHVQNANIYASIAGPVLVNPASSKTAKSTLSVSRSPLRTAAPAAPQSAPKSTAPGPSKLRYNTLPAVDSIVLARVTRVQKRQATVSILVVLDESASNKAGPPPTTTTAPTGGASDNDNIEAILSSAANPENHSNSDELRFQALIRKEDVRAVEKDRVVMDEMFRVGDIVRGTVISLGDQSFYYLTTARNDLGVVMARSEAGNMMFPVSWKEMRDPVTGVAELRKVARPF
ncbi:putative exoribonuclease [Aspergillus japonicus CBS 114.51]|uniref:Putative exoribonuclease n=2 Tax=Aspergillus TaxID=5052 RepID=A0A2V5H128_ASPV1|nr:putative exoribonuclease [Aspergillus japonicus CBS 114.51]PYI17629.1 putative exoribonuclease [Aspergillus violaceofuscus CBS 115571]RAH82163.1 putative exoribonuclease [Aspergillus japonicus CBS 114.51]